MNFNKGEIICIDKPYRMSSFGALAHIRFLISKRMGVKRVKTGHAGTLDPLATGVLILCTGKATKRIDELQAHTKEYTATLQLGATTPSFDMEHTVDHTYPTAHITRELIEETLPKFACIFGMQDKRRPRLQAHARRPRRAAQGQDPASGRDRDDPLRRRGNAAVCQSGMRQGDIYPRPGTRHRRSSRQRSLSHSPAAHKGGRRESGRLHHAR